MEVNTNINRAADMISSFMLGSRNTDGIDEVAIEPEDPTNPDSEQVVRVFYSSPNASYPPECADDITERLDALKLSNVKVEYVQSTPVELH